jgi:spore germination cell wall hydrolase CwlJ-like protein
MITQGIISVVLATLLNTGQFPDNVSHKEVVCMAEAVFFEAKSENQAGKEAVASVILNRTRSGKFPSTVCGVTSQKGQFQYKRVPSRKVFDSDQRNAEESALIAIKALNGGIVDPTKGSLYFVNNRIATHTDWLVNVKQTVRIGQHTFYKDRPKKSKK